MTRTRRWMARVAGIGALVIAGVLSGTATPSAVGAAGAASAGSVTFHLYAVFTTSVYIDPDGQFAANGTTLPPGGFLYYIGNAYLGTKTSHAATATASVDVVCVLGPTSAQGVCDGSIAMGGILMAANHVSETLSATGLGPLELTDATGKYKNDDGLATVALVSSSAANITINLHPEAYLGIDLGTSSVSGAPVASVTAGTSAQKAGLAAGDVITTVDGQPVDSAWSYFAALNQYVPGDKVPVGWTTPSGGQMTGTIVAIGENK